MASEHERQEFKRSQEDLCEICGQRCDCGALHSDLNGLWCCSRCTGDLLDNRFPIWRGMHDQNVARIERPN